MGKKPDFDLEYVYRRSEYKKQLWIIFLIWLCLRIARLTLLFTVGLAVANYIPLAFLIYFSGLMVGMFIMSIIVYRRSVVIPNPENGIRSTEKP